MLKAQNSSLFATIVRPEATRPRLGFSPLSLLLLVVDEKGLWGKGGMTGRRHTGIVVSSFFSFSLSSGGCVMLEEMQGCCG